MKTIVFGFSRPKNMKFKPYAKAIMLVDGINFDHGYIKFKKWGCYIIYQSSGKQTNFMGGEHFRSLNEEVEQYEIDVDDIVEKQIGQLCIKREGRPYPTLSILGQALALFVRKLSFGFINIKNPFPDPEGDKDCIGEQAQILESGLGIKVPFDMDNCSVKPFRDYIASLPNVRRVQ